MNKTRLYEPTEVDKIDKLRTEVKWYDDELDRLDLERLRLDKEIEHTNVEYMKRVIELRKVFE